MTIHWKAVEQYFTAVMFIFQFYPVCNFFENLSSLDLALSGVKGFNLTVPSPKLINEKKLKAR